MSNHTSINLLLQLILIIPFFTGLMIYLYGVMMSNRSYQPWPVYRTISFSAGILAALMAVAGPIAARAHDDFIYHMIAHLLLGMLAPLLLVLAAPMTIILRTLPNSQAKRLSAVLRGNPIRIISHPVTAAFLNIGGLWLLYTTNLFVLMHENMVLYIIIHFHLFLAGYLFTASIIYIDPIPHRKGYIYRSVVLVLALAAHGILSKYLYTHPPAGISIDAAETGAMIMYYGGDAIDLLLIFLLCLQWYRAAAPKKTYSPVSYN